MVFSDQLFLFFFLPFALLLGLAVSRTRLLAPVLLVLSLVFFYWSSGAYVLLLLASIAINYFGGLAIEASRRRRTVLVAVGANIAILLYYKYADFLLSSVGYLGSPAIGGWAQSIVMPIGISFFTFQGISYLVDVWRGEVAPERNPVLFAAYKAFFPQLIAGPIVRYADVHQDFAKLHFSAALFSDGVVRFMVGLCKKVLIADMVAGIADASFGLPAGEQTFASAWLGAIAYTIQIYFDFSGYSDMAIGLALMFGVRFRENFNHPYASLSVTEFWRRWHISLSSWFRDYVYIPLGGNRAGAARTYFNLMVVFVLCGLWHGAQVTFLLWGIYHGAFLVAERLASQRLGVAFRSEALRFVYLLPVVTVGWVLFRANDFHAFAAHLAAMASPWRPDAFHLPPELVLALTPTATLVLGLSCGAVALQRRLEPLGPVLVRRSSWARPVFVAVSAALCALYVIPSSFSPFLYFRF